MKSILLSTCLLVCVSFTAIAQDYYIPLNRTKTQNEVFEYSHSNVRLFYTLQSVAANDIKNSKGETFTELYFGKGYAVGELGEPKIPAFKNLIQVPFGADITVNVVGFNEHVIKLSDFDIKNPLVPNQPSLRKDQDELPFEHNPKAYITKGFSRSNIAVIKELGVLRGMRLARIDVMPIDYDPTSGTIKIYNDIEIEVVFKGGDKSLNQKIQAKTYSPYFEPIYSKVVNPLSSKVYDDNPDLVKYPVSMLVVSDRMFEESLQPYIQWKTKKGFRVEVAYTDEIGGTSTAIKNYVHGVYNEATPQKPAPSFLVLVGDVQQIPASATGSVTNSVTDLYYASVDGDYFPEMYYGRLSAQTPAQLNNIIDKIIYYEKYQFDDPTYLDNVTLIAGTDGTWNTPIGEPTVKYATKYYFNEDNGFNTVWGYGVDSDPNNPNNNSGYVGCYDDERIEVSLINFTAHCNSTSWAGPTLGVGDVHAMGNTNKYPLAIGNCCQSARFNENESIGEAWIRAEKRGAVTYIGSAPNTYWFEDFYWAVGAFPLQGNNDGYVPSFEETTIGVYDAPHHTDFLTTGGLVFVGNLAVTEADNQDYPVQVNSSSALYYWQAYHVLGDPSLTPFFTQGEVNVVSHLPTFPIGVDTYNVEALPGSYVAISKDGVLHGAALVGESGEVNVVIDPILDGGNVDIVITRTQTQPYMEQIPAAAIEGPYVILSEYVINDELGNNNGVADYGESFSIHVTLKNIGVEQGSNITATLSGTDDYFNISDNVAVAFGDIPSGETDNTETIDNAYSFSLADNVPDQHQATFVLEITDGEETWESDLKIVANAPALTIEMSEIIDMPSDIAFSSSPKTETEQGKYYEYNIEVIGVGGNNSGSLDPGETAVIVINIKNTGSSELLNADIVFSSKSEFVTINTPSKNISTITPGQEKSLEFVLQVSDNAPAGSEVELVFNSTYAGYLTKKEFKLPIGLNVENFESGNFRTYPWEFDGDKNWIIQDSEAYEGSFSARSGNISHDQTTSLVINIDVIEDSDLSFFLKTDCEGGAISQDWDHLKFYVDDFEVGAWNGQTPWTHFSYMLREGTRELRWTYKKDGSVSTGEDCAWIDKIVFPPNTSLVNRPRGIDFIATEKPVWLNLSDNTNGTAVLFGTAPYEANSNQVSILATKGTYEATQNFQIQVIQPTSVNVYSVTSKIYPNPFNSSITISNTENLEKIRIVNIFGQIIRDIDVVAKGNLEINTTDLPNGVYVITLQSKSGKVFVHKLLKN